MSRTSAPTLLYPVEPAGPHHGSFDEATRAFRRTRPSTNLIDQRCIDGSSPRLARRLLWNRRRLMHALHRCLDAWSPLLCDRYLVHRRSRRLRPLKPPGHAIRRLAWQGEPDEEVEPSPPTR